MIQKKIAKESDQWIAFYNYGNALHALHDYKGAEEQFLNGIDKNPQQPELWKNLGTIYYHLQNHDKEIECYDKAMQLDPGRRLAAKNRDIAIKELERRGLV